MDLSVVQLGQCMLAYVVMCGFITLWPMKDEREKEKALSFSLSVSLSLCFGLESKEEMDGTTA